MADDVVADTPDSADPQVERNQRREAQRRARADADVVRGILHAKEGRDWFYRKLAGWHLYAEGADGISFAPGQPDVTAFRLGEENCAKQLEMEARNASLDLYMKMLSEQRDEQKRLDAVRREERERRDAAAAAPTDTEAMTVHLPPPPGYPGHVPPKPLDPKAKR